MDKNIQHNPDIGPDRIDFDFMDASTIHLFRGPSGIARMKIDGHDKSFIKIMIASAFPLSEPNRYIGFLDGQGNDIGTIRDISELDHESAKIVQEELKRRYFLPRIKKIIQLSHDFESTYIKVETDKGIRDFTVRGHRENCPEVSPGRFIMEDVDGNRFEILDIHRLDKKSQSLLMQIL
ncbi:MAG: DUF1854 domain-containing protein [Armatimonadota bacterium]